MGFLIKADIEADLMAHARQELKSEWGDEVDAIENRNVLIHYFDAMRRRATARPRKIELADDFLCSVEDQPGWDALQEKIRNGGDINAHMSKAHASLRNRDGLLNEWGVHHFHLGLLPDPRKPNYVKRTGSIILALVEEDAFRAINIYQHRDWAKPSIIESLHRNWPESIRRYRLCGVAGEPLSPVERISVRSAGAQSAVAVSDGTVYGSIGGPVSAAGTGFDAVVAADRWLARARDLQNGLAIVLSQVLPTLIRTGHPEEGEIVASLRIEDGRWLVLFPAYNLSAEVKIL